LQRISFHEISASGRPFATCAGRARLIPLGLVMDTLGISLIAGGMAFLFSGLFFLLPTEQKLSLQEKSIEEDRERIECLLHEMRSQRLER
jgi:hypothetical protein